MGEDVAVLDREHTRVHHRLNPYVAGTVNTCRTNPPIQPPAQEWEWALGQQQSDRPGVLAVSHLDHVPRADNVLCGPDRVGERPHHVLRGVAAAAAAGGGKQQAAAAAGGGGRRRWDVPRPAP